MKKESILSSVQNGLSIIKIFTKEKPIWGITEISRTLNLPKSTVSRLITDLVNEGYLKKVGNKYSLGLSILTLSGVIMSRLEIHREAHEPLKALVRKVNENAHISTLEGIQLIYLLKVECNQAVRLLSHVGHYRPVTCSSPGKLLLAYQTSDVINEVIKAGLTKRGPDSITDPAELVNRLKKIKQQGYDVSINEMNEDVVSIAAPIKDYLGNVIASVSIAGPRHRIVDELVTQYVPELVKTGENISHQLGYMETPLFGGGGYE
ncbi:IclR family transcriptional regulator [Niallia sp. Krafla_26]|uniref:IclR family transcriptional regulator n=1 Tax=Niallia sp. Krafla_26 TaxID=3064703 RepID=UPI003D16FFF9